MDLVVSAGPYQTRTRWDGTYRILGLAIGNQAISITAQHGRFYAKPSKFGLIRPVNKMINFTMIPAAMHNVTFRVTVPFNAPNQADKNKREHPTYGDVLYWRICHCSQQILRI